MKRYAEVSDAVKFLKSQSVNVGDKTVKVSNPSSLRILGAVDYLKQNGYTVTR